MNIENLKILLGRIIKNNCVRYLSISAELECKPNYSCRKCWANKLGITEEEASDLIEYYEKNKK